MASEYTIRINYNRAVKQAEELEEIANDMNRLAKNDMSTLENNIKKSWTGDNANAYLSKLLKVGEDIGTTADDINKVAKTIKKIARQIRDAEMEALKTAQERSSQTTII